MPPATATYALMPSITPSKDSNAPPGTAKGRHAGAACPSIRGVRSAPVMAITVSSMKRRRRPARVVSSPASVSRFPTMMLAERKANRSSPPETGTPYR